MTGAPDRRSVNALQPGSFAGLQHFVCAVRRLVSDLYVRRVQRTVIQNVIQVCISVVEPVNIFRRRRRVGGRISVWDIHRHRDLRILVWSKGNEERVVDAVSIFYLLGSTRLTCDIDFQVTEDLPRRTIRDYTERSMWNL